MNSDKNHERVVSTKLDEILGKSFKVLDDGFIRVVDYMGSDESIVQAARVSYGKGTKKVSEDKGLIRYLLRNKHTTPFEMCEIKFHIRVPMDTWRQWIRHRTASVNEYSTRYSIAIDSMQRTGTKEWRKQSNKNKQGGDEILDGATGALLTQKEEQLHSQLREIYIERIENNVAREQARKDLPLSTYTEAYWKIDLHNLFNFLTLRMDSHAQLEIRSYANIIGNEILSRWCPISWSAFEDYVLNSTKFSRIELKILKCYIDKRPEAAKEYLLSQGLLKEDNGKLIKGREAAEIESKLQSLGFQVDWA